jgi:hypothetical protein
MDLSAAMLAAEDRQTARERGLSSELLSAFTGVPEGAMFGGQYADVDTAGLAEGRLDRASQERIAAANLAQARALADRDFTQLSAAELLNLKSQGIDPVTGRYTPIIDPETGLVDPYGYLSPSEAWEAQMAEMQANKIPLTSLASTLTIPDPNNPTGPRISAIDDSVIQKILADAEMSQQPLTDETFLLQLRSMGVDAGIIALLLQMQATTPMSMFLQGDQQSFQAMEDILGQEIAVSNANQQGSPTVAPGGTGTINPDGQIVLAEDPTTVIEKPPDFDALPKDLQLETMRAVAESLGIELHDVITAWQWD